MIRYARLVPLAVARRVPAPAWWLLKRLPRRWSERFLLMLISEIYTEFSDPGIELDDELLAVLFEPDVEWIQPTSFPDRGEYHGHSGVRAEIRDFMAAFSEFRTEVRSVALDPQRETVFVTVYHAGRGRTSGADTRLVEFHLYRVRRGRVSRLDMFTDERAAEQARLR